MKKKKKYSIFLWVYDVSLFLMVFLLPPYLFVLLKIGTVGVELLKANRLLALQGNIPQFGEIH